MLRFSLILAAGLGLGVMATSAEAASFNCAKAKSPTEKTICGNATLSILDQRMGAKYKVLIKLLGAGSAQADQIRAEQVWWLSRRDSCGTDAFCVRGQIADRIMDLDGYLASAKKALAG